RNELVRSLEPTDFSSEPGLRIDPDDARIARLQPQALKPDSIEQVASTAWIDGQSHAALMLVYFDRPARITGTSGSNGHTYRYNIRAGQAGYVWIGCVHTDDGQFMHREVERPTHVVLALVPKTDGGSICQGVPTLPVAQAPGAD